MMRSIRGARVLLVAGLAACHSDSMHVCKQFGCLPIRVTITLPDDDPGAYRIVATTDRFTYTWDCAIGSPDPCGDSEQSFEAEDVTALAELTAGAPGMLELELTQAEDRTEDGEGWWFVGPSSLRVEVFRGGVLALDETRSPEYLVLTRGDAECGGCEKGELAFVVPASPGRPGD